MGEGVLLCIAELEHDLPVRGEEGWSLQREQSIEVEPIGTSIKRLVGIEVANFLLKLRDFGGGNVRRVGNEKVEFVRAEEIPGWLEGVALENGELGGEAMSLDVLPGDSSGFG